MAVPVTIGKAQALSFFLRFVFDPLIQTRRLHDMHGPFVQLTAPTSTEKRLRCLTVVADETLYREMLSNDEHWRNVKITFNGITNNATRRLTYGMHRLRGARHHHYRRLITPALRRTAVEMMAEDMATTVEAQISRWKRDEPVDLLPLTRGLAQATSSTLLFGSDLNRSEPLCRLISQAIDVSWFLPSFTYFRWAANSPRLERLILEWAEEKRGETNPRDLLSILVNNADEAGNPPDATIIVGLTAFLFGAAYDTCQNGLAWTLILLTQYPNIADELADQIDTVWRGGELDIVALDALPLLEGVLKESLRLFPPIPLQFRKTIIGTSLGGVPMHRESRVLISAHVINRDRRVYEHPDCFLPGRWQHIKPSPFQYTVYGAGGHMCPGTTFGNQMLKVALAVILSRHRVELAIGARIDYRSTITLAPRGSVRVVFRERNHSTSFQRAEGVINQLIQLPAAAS